MPFTQIHVYFFNIKRQFAYVQVHEKGRSRYNYFFNWNEMIRLQLREGGSGYFYYVEMSKSVFLFNCHKPEDKIHLSSCINSILSSRLKCQLPWDPISNSSLEVCSGKEKVIEFHNATIAMAESSAMDAEINNKCLMVPNCETRFWSLTNGNFIKKDEHVNQNETSISLYMPAGSKVWKFLLLF